MTKIAISIGHNPSQRGAVFEDLIEFELATEWVNEILDQYDDNYDSLGYELVLVPSGSLKDKVKFINNEQCDYAIEIHFNSVANHVVSGFETLYMPASVRGKVFAQAMQSSLQPTINNRDRGVKEGRYWSSSEQSNTPLYFLRRTKCPAIIIEPEFLQSYKATINCEVISNFAMKFLLTLKQI